VLEESVASCFRTEPPCFPVAPVMRIALVAAMAMLVCVISLLVGFGISFCGFS
jgi:hypothetical protein